jgi:hypothetical protein
VRRKNSPSVGHQHLPEFQNLKDPAHDAVCTPQLDRVALLQDLPSRFEERADASRVDEAEAAEIDDDQRARDFDQTPGEQVRRNDVKLAGPADDVRAGIRLAEDDFELTNPFHHWSPPGDSRPRRPYGGCCFPRLRIAPTVLGVNFAALSVASCRGRSRSPCGRHGADPLALRRHLG